MGSSSSIDSGLSHDHMMNKNEFDLNNNNDLISSYKSSEQGNSFGKKKILSKKNISYLPHATLLERFSQYGCYRLMGDGYGFAILAKNGPTHQMVYEAFINLSISMNDVDQLIIALNKIVQDLETNIKLTMKEYEDFDPDHPDHQRINNLFAYNLWRKENVDKIMKMLQFLQQWKQVENF
ncbi:ankyrin repeat domain containing protein [Euroglyphus maynei]|uniref:Ankyrin repeat domain containing protein n=1 Tax=Euroglyphus maynei TaxID=6958 RepID=A0A1Y3BWF9_EURMA|nr:ankyrin repeat domain containing protein [Euroglyphus maynei]